MYFLLLTKQNLIQNIRKIYPRFIFYYEEQ